MADLETLTLQINAESQRAYNAIDKLAQRLDRLSISISKLETGKLYELANGLNNLGYQIIAFNTKANTKDFNHLVKSLSSLGTVSTSKIDTLSSSLGNLSTAFAGMQSAAAASDSVKTLVSSLSKLGGVQVQRAITNLPQLEKGLTHLIKSISNIKNIDQSIIDFTNSLTNLASQGSKIGSAAKTINNSLKTFDTSATHSTKKAFNLASAIGKVYAQFWILMRAASGLKNAFKDASDYLESYNYFEVVAEKIGADTFRKAGVGSADEYAEAFTEEMQRKLKQMSGLELDLEDRLIKTTNAKSLGLNLTELTQYQAAIASITNSMGLAQEVSTSAAKAFSMLAADMGSLRNVDFEQVSQNLQSGLTGAAKSLYKYGIDITNATLQQYAYANGVDKAVSEMTQAEKAQLRLLAILDQSKVAWGDLANTINSPANQLRQLKTNLEEVGTVFGQLFIPVMQRVLPWVNGLSIAIKQLLVDIAGILGIQLNLDEFGTGFSDTIDEDTESLDDLNKTMKETKKGIREFDELKVIGANKDNDKSGLSDQIDLTQQILDATAQYEKVWDEAYRRMTSKANEIAGYISSALEPIKKIIEDFHIGNFLKAGEDVSDLAISIFNFISNAIKEVDWKGIGTKIGEFFEGIKWTDVFASVGNLIGTAIQGVLNLWHGSFEVAPYETAILTAFALLKFTSLGQTLTTNIQNSITSWFTNHGVDKNFLAKAGLGAVSVGLSVAFTINNIEKVQTGEYAAFSAESLFKSAISSLLAGAGITMIASALGAGHLGLVFAGTVGLSLAINLIAAKLNEPEPNVERDIAEQQYAWVEAKHLNNIDVVTNITMKAGQVNDQMASIDLYAAKVKDLTERYESLTEAEKTQLKYYSDELIKIMPDIASQIDSVTGAYTGETAAIEKLIATQKAQIRSAATMDILSDLEKQKLQIQPDYEVLKASQEEANRALKENVNALLNYGLTEKDLADIRKGEYDFSKIGNSLMRQYALEHKQLMENKIAADEALSMIESDWEQITTQIAYYTGIYEEDIRTTLENTQEDIKEANDKNSKLIESPKLPNAVKTTMDKIDGKIQNGETVARADMWNMFNSINDSFKGLGDGKVPAEVQATMDNIKKAIEENSPELINYMANLKVQMEQAFANAHYTSKGEVLYNVNDISEKLDKDTNSIAEAVNVGAKPTTKNLEKDLHELFGETLPETVDDGLKDLASTIDSGAGQKAVMGALDTLKKSIVDEGEKLGLNLEFGIIDGVYSGTAKVAGSVTTMVNDGLVTPYEKATETNSPSRLFRRLAENVPEGIALGISDDTPEVNKAIKALADSMQAAFSGYTYNIPSLDLGTRSLNPYASSRQVTQVNATSLFEQMASYRNANGTPVEVVFRVEGDPKGIFKVVRVEDMDYAKRNGHSAFQYGRK